MAGQEDLGDFPAFVVCRPGIDRRRQQVVLERVGEGALLIANDTRNDAYDRVGDDGRRQLATSQYVVTNGYLLRDQVLADPVVNSFIMSAQDNQVYNVRTG